MQPSVRSFVRVMLTAGAVLPVTAFADDDATETPKCASSPCATIARATAQPASSLDLKETPQSISVVTGDMMDQYGADNLNDALRLATGITVEAWETNRTNLRGARLRDQEHADRRRRACPTTGASSPARWTRSATTSWK